MISSQPVWAQGGQAGVKDDAMTQNVAKRIKHRLFNTQFFDEAKRANIKDEQFKILKEGAHDDYFQDMDYGITKEENLPALQQSLVEFFPGITPQQAKQRAARGRNNWIVWTAGNDRFWDYMGRATYGSLDFLKTISNNPSFPLKKKLPAWRGNRWQVLGLVNEPCFVENHEPLEERWGLVLDKRDTSLPGCGKDPFEDESKYPGIKIGSRGTDLIFNGKPKRMEVGSFYGYATGIIGLRLFPNPEFDQKAADNWKPKEFYSNPEYYLDPKVIRPFRVGMSCAFCHVGPSPTNPPVNFNEPKWANLNSNPGAQYYWVDRIFAWDYINNEDSFVYQLLRTSRPGTLDTSLISSDQINNPRTMNAVYNLPERVKASMAFNHREKLSGAELQNNQFVNPPLTALFNSANQSVLSPRVLKDGSDSVGALGALNRVYVNIGLFGEEWVQNFIPVIGGPVITPFEISLAKSRSLNWQATEDQTADLALFFLAASRPDHLADAPGGKAKLTAFSDPKIVLGRKVFAENCAACHSSKLPKEAMNLINPPEPMGCVGPKYLDCWKKYWAYVNTEAFKSEMVKMASQDEFLKGNFLSTEMRIPSNVVDTQLCSPIATNALADNIWDNFSSQSYKALPSIGEFTVNFPESSGSALTSKSIPVPGGGRGFLRPPSLVSIWSTAPFLGNNALGRFEWKGDLEGRMKSFDDSIVKLLNPELRTTEAEVHGGKKPVEYKTSFGDSLTGIMDVTTVDSYIRIPQGYVPKVVWNLYRVLSRNDIQQRNPSSTTQVNSFISKIPSFPNYTEPTEKTKNKAAKRDPAFFADDLSADNGDPAKGSYQIELGPIPAGVPVNLISNITLELEGSLKDKALLLARLTPVLTHLIKAVGDIKKNKGWTPQAKLDHFMKIAGPSLLEVSKCNDFVVNRGHYFGTKYSPVDVSKGGTSKALTPDEKNALIEYIKYF